MFPPLSRIISRTSSFEYFLDNGVFIKKRSPPTVKLSGSEVIGMYDTPRLPPTVKLFGSVLEFIAIVLATLLASKDNWAVVELSRKKNSSVQLDDGPGNNEPRVKTEYMAVDVASNDLLPNLNWAVEREAVPTIAHKL